MSISSCIDAEVAACLERATELLVNGQNQAAIDECNNALLLQGCNLVAYRMRALAKSNLNDRKGALKDLERFQILHELSLLLVSNSTTTSKL